ncbi:hypothetical protein [Mumia sp. Pv 4-285]|uniref:hypothetical protein n=1 Tax=Mumia qirimensis TaxID=3234852 RepID=UPI00351CCBD5
MKTAAFLALSPAVVLALAVGLLVGVRAPEASSALCSLAAGPATGAQPDLDTEQQSVASTIADVARELEVPARGLVVAYATALQESGLRNLSYGDRDSLGVFQQRPSQGWGSAAQVTDPRYAAAAFFGGPDGPPAPDGLLDVPGWETLPVEQAAQAVQASADGSLYAQWTERATAIAAWAAKGLGCSADATAGTCPPSGLPVLSGLVASAQKVVDCVFAEWKITNIGGRASSGHIAGSDHYTGRAVDVMIASWTGVTGIAQGDAVASYFVTNAKAFGVTYVIWRARIWSVNHPQWSSYGHPSGSSNPTLMHMDHVHVSVAGDTATQ